MAELDPNLKALVEANAVAVGALLVKIASGEPDLTEEIAKVSATNSDLRSVLAGTPEPAPPPSA